MPVTSSRRDFLGGLAGISAAAVPRWPALAAAAGDGPPEVTTVRLTKTPALCTAPQFVVEDLLRAEGFTDIQFVDVPVAADVNAAVATGKAGYAVGYASNFIDAIDT